MTQYEIGHLVEWIMKRFTRDSGYHYHLETYPWSPIIIEYKSHPINLLLLTLCRNSNGHVLLGANVGGTLGFQLFMSLVWTCGHCYYGL
jgi:hypothetical protein